MKVQYNHLLATLNSLPDPNKYLAGTRQRISFYEHKSISEQSLTTQIYDIWAFVEVTAFEKADGEVMRYHTWILELPI